MRNTDHPLTFREAVEAAVRALNHLNAGNAALAALELREAALHVGGDSPLSAAIRAASEHADAGFPLIARRLLSAALCDALREAPPESPRASVAITFNRFMESMLLAGYK